MLTGRHKRTARILTLSVVVSLATGLILCLADDPEHPASRAGCVFLAAILAAGLGTLKLFLQLRSFGSGRAMIGVGLLLSLLAVLAALDSRYLLLRFHPKLTRDYRGASLAGAALNQANLDRTNCQDADLTRASLRNAYLNFADLRRASFRGADLRGCMLAYSDLQRADLRGADLREASIIDVTFTTLSGAFYDEQTRWPEGFDPRDWDLTFAGP